jgi:hypothetical protein
MICTISGRSYCTIYKEKTFREVQQRLPLVLCNNLSQSIDFSGDLQFYLPPGIPSHHALHHIGLHYRHLVPVSQIAQGQWLKPGISPKIAIALSGMTHPVMRCGSQPQFVLAQPTRDRRQPN